MITNITITSTPEERYCGDLHRRLYKDVEKHQSKGVYVRDIGGGSSATEADNDFEIEYEGSGDEKVAKAEIRKVITDLRKKGYKVREL